MVKYVYTLGASGESIKVEELDRTVEYTYDELYRLTSETITEGEDVTVYTYAYDSVSNRTLKTVNGDETVYTYNSLNQLISENDTTYEYDNAGNLVRVIGSGKSALYEYNSENKLVKATVQQGNTVVVEEYTYDYEGNRTSKATTTSDGNVEYIQYLNDNSSLTNVLVEIGSENVYYTVGADLISQEVDGEVYTYIYDGHGTVRALANEKGEITDTYSYDAFGNLLKSTGSTANNYLYCGEQYDSTTGLYYLRARYMDTSTGRFISMDTYQGSTADPISLHKYLYANSNPVMYSDPSGYMSIAELGASKIGHAIMEVAYRIANSSAVATGMKIINMLRATVSVVGTKKIIAAAMITVAPYLGGQLSKHYCNTMINSALNDVVKNTKSIVIAKTINVMLSSFLQNALDWIRSKGKTNNDYNDKMARHHIVPKQLPQAEVSRQILLVVGINCFSFSEASPNIVLIKYSTHYALHSNNTVYCAAINSVICTAFFEAYSDGYEEQVVAVYASLLTLHTLIKGLDYIIP